MLHLSIARFSLHIATDISRKQPQIYCAAHVSSHTHTHTQTHTNNHLYDHTIIRKHNRRKHTHIDSRTHTHTERVVHNLNVNILLTVFFDFTKIFLSLPDDRRNKTI